LYGGVYVRSHEDFESAIYERTDWLIEEKISFLDEN
jgi:hypothetical protein